jgi:5-methylcytosine-specific restriction protein B
MTDPSKLLSIEAIRLATLQLNEWRKANDSQGAMHLVHLLAAKYAGATPGVSIPYSEKSVDFAFCDKFLKVNNSENPYFDPFELRHRISSHPHSNVATARKKTFTDKWRAGVFEGEGDNSTFTLNTGYIDVLISKIAKQGHYTKLPPLALAIWFYREDQFDSNATTTDLVNRFRREFHFSDQEWNAIFENSIECPDECRNWSCDPDSTNMRTMIEVLTYDVPGFNFQRSLLAIREVSHSPMLAPSIVYSVMLSLGTRQCVLQGPPGTGKTYLAKQIAEAIIGDRLEGFRSGLASVSDLGSWGLIQLHPSYGYEDFMQRMIPQRLDTGEVTVSTVDMPFVVAAKLAIAIKPRPFVLLIDEMNRADLQSVFGELMYALEYRGQPVTLQYSRESLVVPENLFVIGTMNTADSSVVQVDYAIRRRFVFFDAPPDSSVITAFASDARTRKVAMQLFDAANEACNYHPRFAIGHSYFLKQDIQGLANVFVFQVLPLLRAYQENGVIANDAVIRLENWQGDPITPNVGRVDVLLEAILNWASLQ